MSDSAFGASVFVMYCIGCMFIGAAVMYIAIAVMPVECSVIFSDSSGTKHEHIVDCIPIMPMVWSI